MPDEGHGLPIATVRGFAAPGGPLSFDVVAGNIIVLRGSNGAGKTSLLRRLAGLPAPMPAEVTVTGADPQRLPAAELGALLAFSQQACLDGLVGLTVAGEFRLRAADLPVSVAPLADREVATLSSGEARRVALAVAAQGRPLLLLDEPSEGLDATRRAELVHLVKQARVHGAVVAADHGGLLDAVATRIIDLDSPRRATFPPLQQTGGPVILQSPAATVTRGTTKLPVPALNLHPGFHVVRGPNGSGKSTLLLHLAGVLGRRTVRIAGQPARAGRNLRLLLPHAADLLTKETVGDELAAAAASVATCLVPETLQPRHPLTLSGGQAQRVALAKVLGQPSPVYLLDEPEAFLDGPGRGALATALQARLREGACILAATHDDALIAAAHSVTVMEAAA